MLMQLIRFKLITSRSAMTLERTMKTLLDQSRSRLPALFALVLSSMIDRPSGPLMAVCEHRFLCRGIDQL
jgi:hypothetical protein